MKKTIRLILTAGCLTALVASPTLWAAGKAKPAAPKGTIHPAADVKPEDLPGLAKISFQAALKTALAANPGSVIKAELEVEDGCLMYAFEILGANKKIKEVEIDAGSGKVLDDEDEESEAKEASKRKEKKD